MNHLDKLLELTRKSKLDNESVRDAFARGGMVFYENDVAEDPHVTAARFNGRAENDQKIIDLLEELREREPLTGEADL